MWTGIVACRATSNVTATSALQHFVRTDGFAAAALETLSHVIRRSSAATTRGISAVTGAPAPLTLMMAHASAMMESAGRKLAADAAPGSTAPAAVALRLGRAQHVPDAAPGSTSPAAVARRPGRAQHVPDAAPSSTSPAAVARRLGRAPHVPDAAPGSTALAAVARRLGCAPNVPDALGACTLKDVKGQVAARAWPAQGAAPGSTALDAVEPLPGYARR